MWYLHVTNSNISKVFNLVQFGGIDPVLGLKKKKQNRTKKNPY